jgi:hypothetical protein
MRTQWTYAIPVFLGFGHPAGGSVSCVLLRSVDLRREVVELKTVELSLQNSLPFANSQPTTPMIQVTAWLQIAENDLLTANPNHEF